LIEEGKCGRNLLTSYFGVSRDKKEGLALDEVKREETCLNVDDDDDNDDDGEKRTTLENFWIFEET
jgi:hypothetical protein